MAFYHQENQASGRKHIENYVNCSRKAEGTLFAGIKNTSNRLGPPLANAPKKKKKAAAYPKTPRLLPFTPPGLIFLCSPVLGHSVFTQDR